MGFTGRYHGRILRLARVSTDNGAWKAKLREILAEFDEDCRRLPVFGRDALRNEVASQIELEALRFSDPDKRAVLTLALKHFDAGEPYQRRHLVLGIGSRDIDVASDARC
jgi:hypothetical protein